MSQQRRYVCINVWSRAESAIGAASVALLILAGCGSGGPPSVHLKGAVTIGGQPLPADSIGNVSFKVTSRDQGKSASAQIVDGKYDSPTTPVGKVKVFFNIQQATGQLGKEPDGVTYPIYRSLVPAKDQPGLDFEVKSDETQHDFDL
jgi:hypothetical protein